METPLVTETLGLLKPLDRDPFLIGLGGPARTSPGPPSPDGAPTGAAVARDTDPATRFSRLDP